MALVVFFYVWTNISQKIQHIPTMRSQNPTSLVILYIILSKFFFGRRKITSILGDFCDCDPDNLKFLENGYPDFPKRDRSRRDKKFRFNSWHKKMNLYAILNLFWGYFLKKWATTLFYTKKKNFFRIHLRQMVFIYGGWFEKTFSRSTIQFFFLYNSIFMIKSHK
jgi:hypothetical protein